MAHVGDEVASYRITGVIGRGAMASVFRARDEKLDRDVALKLLDPGYAVDFIFRARFEREYRVAAQLRNDHIVPVYDAGQWGDQLYIAMLLVEGPNLAQVMKSEGPLDLARAVSIVSQVADALDEAHRHLVIHRDVKPANVLLARHGQSGTEHAYLADFGLTLGMEGTHLTRTGGFMGTLAYSAPEQLSGGQIDGRADEYALAATAFQMLTGQLPFKRDNEMALINAQLFDPPPRPTDVLPNLPRRLDSVIARAMAKKPEDRYPTCTDFARALAKASGIALAAPPVGTARRRIQPVGVASVAIGLVVALGIGGAAAFALLSASPSPSATSTPTAIAEVSPSPLAGPTIVGTAQPTPTVAPSPTPTKTPRPTRSPGPTPSQVAPTSTPTAPPPTAPVGLPVVAEGTWSVVNTPTGVLGDPYYALGEHDRRYVINSRCTVESACRFVANTFDSDTGARLGRITFVWNGDSYIYGGPIGWYRDAGGSTCRLPSGDLIEDAYTTRELVSVAPAQTANGLVTEMTGTKTITGKLTSAGYTANCQPYSLTYSVDMTAQ